MLSPVANTYTQIHLQLVFAVKYRAALIHKSWKDELYKYITGIVQGNNHKLLGINGIEDHIHIMIGFRTHQSLADLLQDIKGNSSKWINERGFNTKNFNWQEGYGAFSYSRSHLKNVLTYIENKESHHRKIKFLDEYKILLKKFEVEYDERYIFRDPE